MSSWSWCHWLNFSHTEAHVLLTETCDIFNFSFSEKAFSTPLMLSLWPIMTSSVKSILGTYGFTLYFQTLCSGLCGHYGNGILCVCMCERHQTSSHLSFYWNKDLNFRDCKAGACPGLVSYPSGALFFPEMVLANLGIWDVLSNHFSLRSKDIVQKSQVLGVSCFWWTIFLVVSLQLLFCYCFILSKLLWE